DSPRLVSSTDGKVLGSDPTSASRHPLSKLGQPDSIPALVLPSGGMAVRHRKGNLALSQLSCFLRVAWQLGTGRVLQLNDCLHGARCLNWLEREFTDQKVRGSNPTCASRLPLSRLGQPGSILVLVPFSGSMAARRWKGITAKLLRDDSPEASLLQSSGFNGARCLNWLEREFTDQKVRGSNPTCASRLPLSRLGQPGSILVLVPFSGSMAARRWKGITAKLLRDDSPEASLLQSTVTPFRCLAVMLPEGSMRAGILPGCPRLDEGSREAEVRGSNLTSASRLPFSKLGQPGSIPALVLPSGGMAARHRKCATAERFISTEDGSEAPFRCLTAMPPKGSTRAARLSKPRQGKSRRRGRFRTTDLPIINDAILKMSRKRTMELSAILKDTQFDKDALKVVCDKFTTDEMCNELAAHLLITVIDKTR
ncbi:hypothetical protein T265_13269, partial [Opisthorchis viverrini]